MTEKYKQIAEKIKEANGILIGASNGLSIAEGYNIFAHDEYYGSEPSENAYNNLYELYKQEGLSDEEIEDLLVLDVKDDSYFSEQGVTNQHGQGGGLLVKDDAVMGWLFGK